MGTARTVLTATEILSILLSFGAFLYFYASYYASQWAWCASNPAYTKATCYLKTPPGGYFGSWEFRATLEAIVLFFSLTVVAYLFVKLNERRSEEEKTMFSSSPREAAISQISNGRKQCTVSRWWLPPPPINATNVDETVYLYSWTLSYSVTAYSMVN